MSDRSSDRMLSLVTTITMNPSSAELQSNHLASPTAQGSSAKSSSSSSSEPASASKSLAKQQQQQQPRGGDRDRERDREREREREKEKDRNNSQASLTVVAKPPQEEVDIITQISMKSLFLKS